MTRDAEPRSLPPRLLLVAGAAAVALGTWGFARYIPSESVLAHCYRAIQLFVLEMDTSPGAALPWQLEVARYTAPLTAAASIAIAAIAVSRDRVDRWRARRARGHVIVCGLGRRGLPAALALRQSGEHVVAVEVDRDNPGIDRCRRTRIPVILGDGRRADVLTRAGVSNASHLVVLTSELDVGGEIALAAIGTTVNREHDPLWVHLEVDDPRLAALFRAACVSALHESGWRLDEFDLAAAGGQVMLDELAPWPPDASAAHVLVVGRSPLGDAVVRELARRWRHQRDRVGTLTVTVLDPDAPGSPARVPTPDGVEIGTVRSLEHVSVTELTAVFVCLEDESSALIAALDIDRRCPDLPTLVRVERSSALAMLLANGRPSLHWLSVDDRILTPSFLLSGTQERIARALHDFYRGTVATTAGAASVPWAGLPDSLRASNRAQAAHIATKLATIGCTVVPDDGVPPDRFTAAEINVLGELEHERWVGERSAAGWTFGSRNADARTSPDLVPWSSLSDEVRDIDRRFVEALPDVLADAGLHVRRVTRSGSRPLTALR